MKKILIIIGILSVLAGGSIFFLTAKTQKKAVSEFDVGGYIIDRLGEEESTEAANVQYYFNSGEPYTENTSANTVSFKTVDGSKAVVNRDSFVHFNDNGKEALTKSVIFDTDAVDDVALSYYSVMDGTKLRREGDGYHINNNGEDLVFKNFIWKISDNDYMVVSDTIDFVVDEDNRQQFTDYVQVKYNDSGIVYILTQQGTYSTISSDAYLELANGVRIYLGSKNVSDGEEKKMNLTQMIINSEDNIEIIPDVEYKNEDVKEPKIVVEANDGEDGEDGEPGEAGQAGTPGVKGVEGEAGEEGAEGDEGSSGSDGSTGKAGSAGQNGKNGTNGNLGNTGGTGNPGDPGQEGDPGDPGQNASTAGITYTEEKEPKFHVTDFTSTSYSCEGTIEFVQRSTDPNEPLVDTENINVRIIESDSGRTVYTHNPAGKIVQNAFPIETDGLTPSTNYVLVVNAKYTSASGKEYQKDVLEKYFVTSSVGLDLRQKSVTDSTFTGNLIKTDDNNIEKISVRVYDSEKEVLPGVYLVPQEEEFFNTYNPADGTFFLIGATQSELGVGEQTPLMASALDHNTEYYAQIVVASYIGGVTAGYTFPLVPFMTLKLAPKLEAPYVALAGSESAFTASARYVSDPDNGIVSYRYELYVASDITEVGGQATVSAKPIYTVNANSASAVKIPVDGQVVKEDVNYRVRLVAIFDNNEDTVEYPSPFSDIICLNSSERWPTIINESQIITCSTIEGRIDLTDNSYVIPREVGNTLYVYLKPTYKLYKLINGQIEYWDEEVLIGKVEDLTPYITSPKISIPYKAQGLKYDTNYSIVVRAGRMTDNGVMKENVNVGSASITTKPYTSDAATSGYIPLKINGVRGLPTGQQTFRDYLFFSSNEPDQEKTDQSTIEGVGSMEHFSSKAMEYVKFELQYINGTSTTVLGTTEPIFLSGYSNPDNYRFVKDPTKAVRYNIYDENDTSQYSSDDWNAIRDACIASDSEAGPYTGFGVKLTAESFHDADDPTSYLSYDKIINKLGFLATSLTIHPIVYDYTYVSGNGTQVYWSDPGTSDCNQIICANDYTVTFEMAPPSYETLKKSPFKTNVITIGAAKNKIATYKADTGHTFSNYTANMETEWAKYDNTTAAGLEISGPQEGELWRYANSIQYTIYATQADLQNKVNEVGQSPYLNVSVSSKALPSWTYFMDEDRADAIKRGTTFYVTVSAKLNDKLSGLQNKIYPDEFINDQTTVIKDVTGYIWNNETGFCLAKQKPEVRIAQWDATYGETDQSITYLVDLKDLDAAVVKEATTSEIPQYYLEDIAVAEANRTYEDNPDTSSNTIFAKRVTIHAKTQSDVLSMHYRLKDSDTTEELLKMDSYSQYIMPGRNITLVDATTGLTDADKTAMRIAGDNYVTISDKDTIAASKYLSAEFWYEADLAAYMSRADLDLYGYDDADPAAGTHVGFSFVGNAIDTTETYTNTGTGKTYRCAKVKLSIITEDKLIPLSSYDNLKATVKVFKDSGRYGLNYVNTNSYYASQMHTSANYVNADHVQVGQYYSAICNTGNAASPEPVTYANTEIRVRYVVVNGTTEQTATSKLTFNADGLDYIPRESVQLPLEGKGLENPLKTILPDYKATVDTGYSLADITFTLDGGKGTLGGDASDNMITIFYTPGDLSALADTYAGNAGKANVVFKENELTKDNNWTGEKQITGLTKDTVYSYKAFGYSNGSWSLLYTFDGLGNPAKGSSFKTDPIIDVKYVTTNSIQYMTTTKDEKTVRVTYLVSNAYYVDIRDCLSSSSKLTIIQSPTGTPVTAGENSTILSAMKAAFPGDTEAEKILMGPQSYTFYVDTDWSPKDVHIMNNSMNYSFETSIKYSSGQSDGIAKVDIPNFWKKYEKRFGNGATSIGLVPVVGYDDDPSIAENMGGTFGVSIQGKDQLRLFRQSSGSGVAHNKVTYTIDLLDNAGNKIQSKTIKDQAINDSGSVTYIPYGNCLFTGLRSGNQYKVRVTAAWDNNNDNKIDTTGCIAITELKTIPYKGIVFTSLDLEPDKQRAGCGGSNLNYVTKVEYTLKVNGGEITYHGVLKASGATGDDAKPWSYWTEDPNKPDRYNLALPEMNDASATYELVVQLSGAGSTVEMVNYYGKKTGPASTGGFLSSFVSWLTGN